MRMWRDSTLLRMLCIFLVSMWKRLVALNNKNRKKSSKFTHSKHILWFKFICILQCFMETELGLYFAHNSWLYVPYTPSITFLFTNNGFQLFNASRQASTDGKLLSTKRHCSTFYIHMMSSIAIMSVSARIKLPLNILKHPSQNGLL